MRPAPNHPEYPAAHTCHTGAIVGALRTFFGTDEVRLSFDSRTTGTMRSFTRLSDIVKEVEDARVYAGFHFRSSDQNRFKARARRRTLRRRPALSWRRLIGDSRNEPGKGHQHGCE